MKFKRIVAITFVAFAVAGCSAEDEPTNYPDDTVFTDSTIVVDDVEVLDGTEDGLD